MASVVTRKIPEIVLVDKNQLGAVETFTLKMLYRTDQNEFVICPCQRKTIYLNKSFERVNDLVPIINRFMEQKYCDSKGDKLYREFKDIAGEKAASILNAIWLDYRKERMRIEVKEEAERALERAKKKHIMNRVKKKKDIIRKVFEIGFGSYDKDSKTDFQKGAENAFIYGYLSAMEDFEKRKVVRK